MGYLVQSLLILLLLSNPGIVKAQNDYVNFELDPALKNVKTIQQFTDSQGNIILCFEKNKTFQFVLIRADKQVSSQTFKFKHSYDFLESIYDENYFYLFYRNRKNNMVYLFKTDKQSLPDQLLKIGAPGEKESYLSDAFHQGDLLTFTYSKSPYTIHSYKYTDRAGFQKESQSFDKNKKERFFLGNISTDKEFISIRLSLNPLTLHFYRYFGNDGFEKKSVLIRPLYEEAGIKGKQAFLHLDFLTPDRKLNAFINNDEIYLDLNPLIHLNTFKKKQKRPIPGVLKLNWQSGEGTILMTKNPADWKYDNQRTVLHDSLYFNLAVSRERLDLSIFNIIDQTNLKTFSYSKDQDIKLIQGEANFSSSSTIYLDLFSSVTIPLDIENGKKKKINNKKLLKTLSGEELYLDVFSDDAVIELQVSGANYKDIFIEKTEVANFAGYLSTENLEIIENLDDINDPRWKSVDEYISFLKKEKNGLKEYIAFETAGQLYLVFITKKSNQVRVVQF